MWRTASQFLTVDAVLEVGQRVGVVDELQRHLARTRRDEVDVRAVGGPVVVIRAWKVVCQRGRCAKHRDQCADERAG